MNSSEKEISYQITNTYSSLNMLTSSTKNIWFVCHGMGYLSRYFLKYFEDLSSEENYIIAPQAPSKYYISPGFKHVGSSWLTKENTITETENIMKYFDAVFEAEQLPKDRHIILLGYSQGVSVVMRYLAKRQLQCNQLVLMSGGIPKELTALDFKFLKGLNKVTLIYGNDDEYMDADRMSFEKNKAFELFGEALQIITFEGIHEVKKKFINSLV